MYCSSGYIYKDYFVVYNTFVTDWLAIARQVALTSTTSIIVTLTAKQSGHPGLIRPRHSLSRPYVGDMWGASLWVGKFRLVCVIFLP